MWKRWISFGLIVFALHFAWEMTQAKWFAGMYDLPFWSGVLRCSGAALGDTIITAVAFLAAAAVASSTTWPVGDRVFMAAATFLIIGIMITIGYEVFALSTGRWRYSDQMPTLFGVGLLPLLQWSALPLIELWTFRVVWQRGDIRIGRQG